MKTFVRAFIIIWVLLGVWTILGCIAVSALSFTDNPNSNLDATTIIVAAMAIAGFTTIAVLRTERNNWSSADADEHLVQHEIEKAKRNLQSTTDRSELSLLIELLNEDERLALQQRLQQKVLEEVCVTDDGEIIYPGQILASLLEVEDTKQQ